MRVRPRLLSSLLAAAALATLASPSTLGMTVPHLTVEEVGQRASLVVHGHVVTSHAEGVPGELLASRTRHTLYIWEVFKAADGDVERRHDTLIDVVLPGGVRGPWTTVVPGVPVLGPGDEVVLALSTTPWGWAPVGYSLGTWWVALDGSVTHAWADDEGTNGTAPDLAPLVDGLVGGAP